MNNELSSKFERLPGYHQVSLVVLLAAFLLQPLLTYLVTPTFARDDQGLMVEICTLEGTKLIAFDPDKLSGSSKSEKSDRCGAIELFKFSSIFYTPDFNFEPYLNLYAVHAVEADSCLLGDQSLNSSYLARAPPFIS